MLMYRERTWCSLIDHIMAWCSISDLSGQGILGSQIGVKLSSQYARVRIEELMDDTNGQDSVSIARCHVGWLEGQRHSIRELVIIFTQR